MSRDSSFGEKLGYYLGVASYAASLDSTGKIPAAQIPTPSPLSGAVVQMVSVSVKGFTTTAGIHAGGFDNVPIGSAEGSTFGLSVNLKPTATANRVYVIGNIYGASDAVVAGLFWGLFLAGSSSAVIAGGSNGLVTSDMVPMGFHWQATTVSTATTSYALRLGTAAAAGTFTLNGEAGAGRFGNVVQSSLTVWEVAN